RNAQAQEAGNQRLRLVVKDVVEARPRLVGDLENIAKPFGREQPGLARLVLDDGVCRHGRAVDHEAHLLGNETEPSHDFLEAGKATLGRVVRYAWHLGHENLAGFLGDHDDVGECPADVNSQTIVQCSGLLRHGDSLVGNMAMIYLEYRSIFWNACAAYPTEASM